MGFISHAYTSKLDAKGRLVLPTKLKAGIPETNGDTLVLMLYFEPCLALFTMVEYNKIASKVAGLNDMKKENRNIQRNFFRRSVEVELDSAGRILIPKNMLQAVNIDKDVLVMGSGKRIEIWNPETYQATYDMDNDELADSVDNLPE